MAAIFVGIYLLANLGVGWWASRRVKSVNDYVLAGRRLPLFMASSALFATWFGSETVLGASSEFMEHGLLGVIEDPFGAALCLFLVGLLFARKLYRLNILTFSDYFGQRFGKRSEYLSALLLVPSYFGWIAAQLVAMGIILHTLTGIPLGYGIGLCTVIVVFYTYLGGMWAVAITDFVQTVVIILGLAALAVSMLVEAGGWQNVVDAQPKGFFNFLPPAGWTPGLEYFAAWITIGLGSIPQQDVFQRVMSAKSEKTAIRASFLGSGMYLVIAFLPLVIALTGKFLYPDLSPGDSQLFLPRVVLAHAHPAMQVLFFGALLSAILSTTSGAVLAPAVVLAENLLSPLMRRDDNRHLLGWMRGSVAVVAVFSAGLAMLKSNIYELVGESSAFSLVSLFVPLTAGLYWKRANATGALLSMVLGFGSWIVFERLEGPTPTLIWATLISLVGMVVGSLASDWVKRGRG
ncbi:MAG: sodium:solute symporter family protein [Bacteroidia bacterium]|nr:sodium:solute symporter family protein [Bacteroidia bacterium]